jgi:hypothetical protein
MLQGGVGDCNGAGAGGRCGDGREFAEFADSSRYLGTRHDAEIADRSPGTLENVKNNLQIVGP